MSVRISVVLVGLAIVFVSGACSGSDHPMAPSPMASMSATAATPPLSADPAAAAMAEVRGVIKEIDAARKVFALQLRRGVTRVRLGERTEIILLESRRPVPFSHLAKGMHVAVRGAQTGGVLNARWIAILPGR